jgi:hypothetical protein
MQLGLCFYAGCAFTQDIGYLFVDIQMFPWHYWGRVKCNIIIMADFSGRNFFLTHVVWYLTDVVG